MDYDARNSICKLIENITDEVQAGEHLDHAELNALKKLLRASDGNMAAACEILFERLQNKHSQKRLRALLLIDVMFTRSKHCRALLVPLFEKILELSVGFRLDSPLPPPKEAADNLRERSLQIFAKWDTSFGQHYRQ
ncbi:hypothetical protein CYMTET_39222, partial [Cymbomonas tetramitiformis]